MKLYLTLVLFLFSIKAMACYCDVMPEIQTKEDVDSYAFIALVKIVGLSPINPASGNEQLHKSGDIGIEIKEQFKGDKTQTAYDQSFSNNCALDLHKGEMWLLFGNMVNGKLVVGSCGRTQRYADSTGMRNWWTGYYAPAKHLDLLRQFYGHPIVTNAEAKVLYPNGHIEVAQTFKNGKLNGIRTVYFPNGQVYMTERFKSGERVGEKKVYFPDGQLMTHEEYSKGLIKRTILYHDTAEIAWYLNYQAKGDALFGDKTRTPVQIRRRLDSLRKAPTWGKQINSIYQYSDNGRSYTRKFYALDGKLNAETYLNWDKKISEHKEYYPDGKLKMYEIMDMGKDQELETDYHEDGTKHDYVNKCRSCKFYFNPDEPAATPDKVYIQ